MACLAGASLRQVHAQVPAQPAGGTEGSGASPTAATGAAVGADLIAKTDAIAAKVASLRGLKVKKKIARDVMTKDQIRARLEQRIDEEYSAAELLAEELALKRFGLLGAGDDYRGIVLKLLTDQIAGFYDPAEGKLYIAGWTMSGPEAMQADMLMAHEIDHALQDQHFALAKYMRRNKDNSDEVSARQAVVEGDGTALMLEYVMDQNGVSTPWANDQLLNMLEPQMAEAMAGESFGTAPLVLREGLIFPYLGGLKFVSHFRKTRPWSAIDAVYKRPPLSTEQIIHPEKYEANEAPIAVKAKAPTSLPGYEIDFNNVSGEAGISVYLQQHGVDKARAKQAAAGWGGDRFIIVSPKEHRGRLSVAVAAVVTVWDAEADAIEYFEAMGDALRGHSRGQRVANTDSVTEYATFTGSMYSVERRGDLVVTVINAPLHAARGLRSELFDAWSLKR